MKTSIEYLRQQFPDQFEKKLGNVKVLPTRRTSIVAYHQHWLNQHQHDFIEVEAWDDTCLNVPAGKVLVRAALGGDENRMTAYWMVDQKRYTEKRTEFGYIICNGDEPKALK